MNVFTINIKTYLWVPIWNDFMKKFNNFNLINLNMNLILMRHF